MKLRDYLSDRKFLILIYLVTSLFTGVTIYIEEAGSLITSTGLYVVEVSLAVFTIYLMIDFILRRKHYNMLKKMLLMDNMDWVNSMPESFSKEQIMYYELLVKLYKDYNKRLDELSIKSKEDLEFITMWVHEIKTPIAASKLIIENSLDDPSEKTLYSIEDELDKIEDFVQMSLFYSRTNDFAQDYIISSISLEKVIQGCIKREYSGIMNKKLQLSMENLDLIVETDEKWLGFIIKQILDNAVKYSQPDGKIKIYTEQKEKETILYIVDEGVGIKKEDIGRIFDKNFTGFNGRRQYTSTGIGLYLSQKSAKKLGHLITVTSEFEAGTKVAVHFAKFDNYYNVS
jgi:signal transduction histidine kinase